MRFLIVITLLLAVLFGSCMHGKHAAGNYVSDYSNLSSGAFSFSNANKFKYYYSTVAGLLDYSSGTWGQKGRKIYLNGFDDQSIKMLSVESKIEYGAYENRDKIIVKYNGFPLDTFTKIDVLINGISKTFNLGDTILYSDLPVKTLQIKAYSMSSGMLRSTPSHIDTLYSPELKVSSDHTHNELLLMFSLVPEDFFRIRLQDSLKMKSRHVLIWRKMKLKRTRKNIY